jgi:uncharacterized protein (DUF486 family)
MDPVIRGLQTVGLLFVSNTFMTFAWYGHLKLTQIPRFSNLPLIQIVVMSWGLAFFEYCAQVPANRIGFNANGGPYSMVQLKIIQEAVSLTVFTIISTVFLGGAQLQWNHYVAFGLIIVAVFFGFLQ